MMRAQSTTAVPGTQAEQVLFVLRGANMQLTTDQAFTKLFSAAAYKVRDVFARRKTGACTVACAGGVYDAASKGGNAIVASGQSWVTLASGVNVTATLAAIAATGDLSGTPFLSLTTGSTGACTADLFITGYVVD